MKKHIYTAILTAFLVIPCIGAHAADGTDALPFVRVNHDPVASAMGGAGIVNGTAYSSFRNTAALSFWNKGQFDVAADYQSWANGDTQNVTVGAGLNLGKIALSIGGNYGMEGSYDVYDDTGAANGSYSPYNYQVNVGIAWKFLKFLSIGADFKYVSDNVASGESHGALAVDAFLMTKLAGFRIAAGISSVGTSVKDYYGNKYSLPTSVTVAGGYDHEFGKHGINVALDLDYYYQASEFTGALGAEYSYHDMLFVRAGYRYAADTAVIPSYASVGLGFKIIGIRIDAAYLIGTGKDSVLKNCFNVGLGFGF